MTKEQAIEILNHIKIYEDIVRYDDDDVVNTCNMAIKALEQQPSDDCVSRQAVLDMAETIQTDDFSGNEILEVVNIDDIKALPPVTPTHGKCKNCSHNEKCKIQELADGVNSETFYCGYWKGRE